MKPNAFTAGLVRDGGSIILYLMDHGDVIIDGSMKSNTPGAWYWFVDRGVKGELISDTQFKLDCLESLEDSGYQNQDVIARVRSSIILDYPKPPVDTVPTPT
jgi:hypothetical protein